MNHTSRMVALLSRMRRERNGAVADAMYYYGIPYGLNYGVSLPTIRQIARAEPRDHAFARMLWEQDVRELKLAALHIAEPKQLTIAEASAWADGIVNSELAEEAAFALLRHSPHLEEIADAWMQVETPLPAYATLLGMARATHVKEKWLRPALTIAHNTTNDHDRLIAQGAVALLETIGRQNETSRQAVLRIIDPFESSDKPAEKFIREELLWRLADAN